MARPPHPLRPPQEHRRLVEIAQDTRRRVGLDRSLLKLPPGLAEQLRPLDDPPPYGPRASAPGLVQCPDLAGGERAPRDRLRQRLCILAIGARQGQQEAHRRVGRDLARAHELLDGHGELPYEPEPARDPARAPGKPHRQLLQPPPGAFGQLGEQPPLLEHRLAPRYPQGAHQEKRFRLGHRPHHRPDGVLPQPREHPHSGVPVDEHVALSRRCRHDHHRRLLPHLGQRGQQPPLGIPAAYPQSGVAQVKLVMLDVDDGVHASRLAWVGSGLFVRRWSLDQNPFRPGILPADLVFRHTEDLSCRNNNRISDLAADLVFQQVPRKSPQSRRRRQRWRQQNLRELHGFASPCRGSRSGCRFLRCGFCLRPLRQPPMVGVLRIGRPPCRLRPGAALLLAFRPRACLLALADSWIRTKPPTTDSARPLVRHAPCCNPGQRSRRKGGGPVFASRPGSVQKSAEGRLDQD